MLIQNHILNIASQSLRYIILVAKGLARQHTLFFLSLTGRDVEIAPRVLLAAYIVQEATALAAASVSR